MALPRRTPLLLLALLLALLLTVAEGFFLLPSTMRASSTTMTAQRSQQSQTAGLDRKAALQQGALLTSAFLFVTGASPLPGFAKDNKPPAASFEECVSKLLLSKKVLQPVAKYIKIGQVKSFALMNLLSFPARFLPLTRSLPQSYSKSPSITTIKTTRKV